MYDEMLIQLTQIATYNKESLMHHDYRKHNASMQKNMGDDLNLK
jgi:hypothetical protein